MSPRGVSVGTSVSVGVMEVVMIGNAAAVLVGASQAVSLGIHVRDGAVSGGKICCCTNMHALMNTSMQAKKVYMFRGFKGYPI